MLGMGAVRRLRCHRPLPFPFSVAAGLSLHSSPSFHGLPFLSSHGSPPHPAGQPARRGGPLRASDAIVGGPGYGPRKGGVTKALQDGRTVTRGLQMLKIGSTGGDRRFKGPRSKVQGPRSDVDQGPRSKVQGPRSKVQGPGSTQHASRLGTMRPLLAGR